MEVWFWFMLYASRVLLLFFWGGEREGGKRATTIIFGTVGCSDGFEKVELDHQMRVTPLYHSLPDLRI